MVACSCNPSTGKAEAGGSPQVEGQPGLLMKGQPELYSEILFFKKKKSKEEEKSCNAHLQ